MSLTPCTRFVCATCSECDHSQDPRSLRERAPLCVLRALHQDAPPQDGRCDRARERGGPVRGDRAPPDEPGVPVPEAHLRPGLREDRALRI